ncbi:MAG: hypothetical protein AAGH65_06165 [Pseudomonadota bacterium]
MTNESTNAVQDRIDQYLRGQLSQEETRQFELKMLEDHQLFEQVQREEMLRQGIAEQAKETSAPVSESQQRIKRKKKPLMQWLQPVLAGGFALVLIALGINNVNLRQQLNELQSPRPGIPVITLHEQRTLLPETGTNLSELGNINGPFLLEIDVSAYEEQEFRVEIKTYDDIYIYERVQSDLRGYLTILIRNSNTDVNIKSTAGEELIKYSNY